MIIQSLLDTDLYKLTMLQAMVKAVPEVPAVYRFKCRNNPEFPLAELVGDVRREVEALSSLRFTGAELDYLGGLYFMSPWFIDYLENFRLLDRHLVIDTAGGDLVIEARGPITQVTMFEIYLLAIVSELYVRCLVGNDRDAVLSVGRARLQAKIALANAVRPRATPFEVFDFSARRRASRTWQEEVVTTLKVRSGNWFKGTSNVDLARRLGLVPIGTMAHEFLQIFQAVGGTLPDFQKRALGVWVETYRGALGIALTDVISMDAFLRDFDLFFAKLFDGLRHDSGDPIVWGEKALAHYAKLRVPTVGKRLVFSDSLNFPRAIAIYDHFADRIQTGFGIGTNLGNDLGLKPLNIVMKLVEANGQPVAKLSDAPGKTLCANATYVAYLRSLFP